ncbi:hypothetical protein ACVIM8_001571 [Bradyrhizobium sp. USDA 4529]
MNRGTKPCFIAAARKIAAATALVSPLEWTRRYHPSYARTDRRGERADPERPCGMRECPRSDLLRVFFTAGLLLLFAGQSRAEQATSKGAPTGKLHSKDRSKQASSAAGPGYTSAHPAFRNSCSVKPPQNTPTVRTAALPAASASRITNRAGALNLKLLENDIEDVRRQLCSSMSSEEVVRSTRSTTRAMPRYSSTSFFLAEEATAIRTPASRTRRSSFGTAEKGRTSGRSSDLKRLPRTAGRVARLAWPEQALGASFILCRISNGLIRRLVRLAILPAAGLDPVRHLFLSTLERLLPCSFENTANENPPRRCRAGPSIHSS